MRAGAPPALLLLLPLVLYTAPAAGAAPSADERCTACALLTRSLLGSLASTRAELDKHRDAKAEAIGKVQKAQTKRWLKQEYGASLYSSVEDEMEKVCALPALSSRKRACEAVREDGEDELVRAVLDGTTAHFCEARVEGCAAGRAAALLEKADAQAAPPPSPAPGRAAPPPAKPAAPSALRAVAATNWSAAILDSAHDVAVLVRPPPGGAGERGAELSRAVEAIARASARSALLNATLAFYRWDLAPSKSKNKKRGAKTGGGGGDDDGGAALPWGSELLEPSAEACAPALLLYGASAKETPRVLEDSCPGTHGADAPPPSSPTPAAAAAAADGSAPPPPRGGWRDGSDSRVLALVEGLYTYVTATPKHAVLKLATELDAGGAGGGGKKQAKPSPPAKSEL